jgi:outer membrane lipoprotein-sorting protein
MRRDGVAVRPYSATNIGECDSMRRFLCLPLLFLCAAVMPAHAASFDAAQEMALQRVSDYLNGIQSAEGHFLQIGPDGKSEQGMFYLRKPGRVRFEYQPPNPNLIIADGSTVAVENNALKTTNRYPLVNSPLRLLLSDKVDLATDPRIVAVQREAGSLSVTAEQKDGPAAGRITLLFADMGSSLELRQWEVIDAQNMRTLVALTDLREGVDLPANLFIIKDLNPFKARRD